MKDLRYRPGTWLCLVRDSVLCLLPPDTGEERIREIWSLLGTTPALDRVFSAVSGGLSGSLADMPSFGVLSLRDRERLHVILRGPLELQAAGKDEPAASGEFVTTWSERVLPAGGSFTLKAAASDGAAGSSAEKPLLPLESGAALVSMLEFGSLEVGSRGTAGAKPAGSQPTQVQPVPVLSGPVQPVPVQPVESQPAPIQAPSPEGKAADLLKPGPAAEPLEPGPAAGQSVEPAQEPVSAEEPDLSETVRPPEEAFVPSDTLQPAEASLPPAPKAADAPSGALIDSVPWLGSTSTGPVGAPGRPATVPVPAVPVPAAAAPVAPAPLAPAPAAPAAPAVPAATPTATAGQAPEDLDHDGDTIMSSELTKAAPAPAPAGQPNTAPTVLARTCPQGHANPPTRSVCVHCGQQLGEEPHPVSRPALGRAVFSTGQAEVLDRNIVVGRQPSVARAQGSDMPRMVQVPSSGGDISRSHAEIRLEGWHVMLRDLFSTNGTVLVRNGQLPHRLGQGEGVIVLDGDTAELGDDVWIRFEGLA
ncbi:FHA domain-containing protein [Arthrobacter sp. zg-Y1110]|uniref:FHA domain-containing protein n=1 Tax=Arthrobacter sp. zg-Y1110 TaxID=2886932 RepID=UPI001D13CB06|nr:FHA domain-containing protein [Arthrobacter sp. zg-Y1110]MCC3292100.1 FHA domain-containing protein [Arthrobacter sp. zg-Y1110]UWX85904.1 FHA domain-containing protein [Arthrobacter sp. zg-Y1110]